jgi:ABC-type spermidine/putrescine transport system permease subunit II
VKLLSWGRLSRIPLLLFVIFAFAALYVPLVLVILNAFNKDVLLAHWGGFTWHWVSQAVSSSRVRNDFVTSAIIALCSSLLSLAIAVPAGLWARGASPRGRRILDATTYMRIVLPEIVAALGLLIFFRRINFPLGLVAVIIGHVVFNSAYAIVIIQARLATMTTVLEDVAADLGARPWRVFWRVTMPFLLPALIVAWLLAFTFSFDDVITSSFLAGSSTETLPMLIFGLARFRVDPEVNAIGALLMTITLSCLFLTLIVAGGRAATGGVMIGSRRERQSA